MIPIAYYDYHSNGQEIEKKGQILTEKINYEKKQYDG